MRKELIDFIREAKKQGYASTTAKWTSTEDGGKTITFKSGKLIYTDTYFGNLIDCGQERVYENGKVIWMMAYRGGILVHEEMHGEAFDFLKKCISKMPANFPARGPKNMKLGKWRYENKWKGDIESFTGEENIYYNGKKICFRYYLGGLIRNKK